MHDCNICRTNATDDTLQQARELDPKLPYVVARLDEVELQQAGDARHADYRTRSPRAIGVGGTDAPEPAVVR